MAKHLVLAVIILSSIFVAASAHADQHCQTLACRLDQVIQRDLSSEQVAALPAETKDLLQIKAEELANIWGDTILEGDYYADDEVRIDRISELYRAQQMVGYRITYSSKAWDTSNCEFDYDEPTSLEACQPGRIVESGIISSDFKSIQRDPNNLATFEED